MLWLSILTLQCNLPLIKHAHFAEKLDFLQSKQNYMNVKHRDQLWYLYGLNFLHRKYVHAFSCLWMKTVELDRQFLKMFNLVAHQDIFHGHSSISMSRVYPHLCWIWTWTNRLYPSIISHLVVAQLSAHYLHCCSTELQF